MGVKLQFDDIFAKATLNGEHAKPGEGKVGCLLELYQPNGRLNEKHLFYVTSKIDDKIGLTASPGFACSLN